LELLHDIFHLAVACPACIKAALATFGRSLHFTAYPWNFPGQLRNSI
jgi:hypothetical protein